MTGAFGGGAVYFGIDPTGDRDRWCAWLEGRGSAAGEVDAGGVKRPVEIEEQGDGRYAQGKADRKKLLETDAGAAARFNICDGGTGDRAVGVISEVLRGPVVPPPVRADASSDCRNV